MPALPEPAVRENRVSGIMARSPRHAAARVRSRAAKIKPLKWHPIISGAKQRSRAEQLVEPHFAMKDVAANQPEAPLEIKWRVDLPAEN